jgi:hypothetical protein
VSPRSTTIAATPAEVWATLAAFDRISEWADGVSHSAYTTVATEGVGAARRVQVSARMALIETVTIWEPDQTLAYTLEGLPPLVESVTNRWDLEPAAGGTLVTLTTIIDPGTGLAGRIGRRGLGIALGRASKMLVGGLASRPWTGGVTS